MVIPQDPFMLLSMVNMKLRDGDYDTLEDLCDSLGITSKELKEKLSETGYEYREDLKQFR